MRYKIEHFPTRRDGGAEEAGRQACMHVCNVHMQCMGESRNILHSGAAKFGCGFQRMLAKMPEIFMWKRAVCSKGGRGRLKYGRMIYYLLSLKAGKFFKSRLFQSQ